MAKLDHLSIVKMMSHWKDDDKLYMLLKMYQGESHSLSFPHLFCVDVRQREPLRPLVLPGGELHSVIHTDTRDGLPEWAAQFYAATILEGLSYMHNRHIIYRDLKPEDVLLDHDGYTVIVDLGFAKIIKDKTYTFCGTPIYLAPEIIMQKGHDKAVDHWVSAL